MATLRHIGMRMIREGRFSDEQNVVFLHTGGWSALFAYEEELTEKEAPR
jgi:1-aminocyclopropane-1-carboxylate deaminase/D-cysteine desulfhydrase-like pyridoxal-dependent ACC family enzyme